METKRPKAGEWWKVRSGATCFIAFDESSLTTSDTPFLVYFKLHDRIVHSFIALQNFVELLPGGTVFDWGPEEKKTRTVTLSEYIVEFEDDDYRHDPLKTYGIEWRSKCPDNEMNAFATGNTRQIEVPII